LPGRYCRPRISRPPAHFVAGPSSTLNTPRFLGFALSISNLRKKGINKKTVKWIGSFLHDKYTRVIINEYTSKKYETATNIPQGSLLSPILYLFYNADLMESCNTNATMAIEYIDDVAIIATGNTTKQSCDKLATALTIANQWAQKHASIFAPEKFQLIYFTKSKTTDINQMLSIT
jgi:hypothetical protein